MFVTEKKVQRYHVSYQETGDNQLLGLFSSRISTADYVLTEHREVWLLVLLGIGGPMGTVTSRGTTIGFVVSVVLTQK